MPTLQEVLKERYDDAPSGAQGLGQLKKTRTIKGFIGSFDVVDYYRVKLIGRSSLTASLSGIEGKVNVRITNEKGEFVAKGKKASVAKTLDAGVYFIQVSRSGSATNYLMKASVTGSTGGNSGGGNNNNGGGSGTPTSAPIDSSDPGSFPAKALDVGKLDATSKSFKGAVGGLDAGDVFKFALDKPGQFISSVSGVTGGDVVTNLVYDINGNGLVDDGDKIDEGADITKSLGAGTYFVSVVANQGSNVGYNLKLSSTTITGITPTNDPPMGLGKASDLGTINGTVNVKQLVGSTDSTDIYKFTLNSVSNFSALLNSTQRTGDVTISLIYDQRNDGIADPNYSFFNGKGETVVNPGDFMGGVFTTGSKGGAALGINKTLGAGTYYLAVTQKKLTDNSTYDLSLFVNNTVTGINPATDPGNSVNTAADLGALTGTINTKQFVGAVDGSDFYKFTLSQERNIIITYNGSPELAVLRLGQDRDGNGFLDIPEDLNTNGVLDYEDLNSNGILDLGEDQNNNNVLDSEDLNRNGRLDPGEVYEPAPTLLDPIFGRAVYAPLPPFHNNESKFVVIDDNRLIYGFKTTVPTAIYAKLPAGTYIMEVDNQGIAVDLGDSAARSGPANILYNLSFQLDS